MKNVSLPSGVRADPLYGVLTAGGAEDFSQHASVHLPGKLKITPAERIHCLLRVLIVCSRPPEHVRSDDECSTLAFSIILSYSTIQASVLPGASTWRRHHLHVGNACTMKTHNAAFWLVDAVETSSSVFSQKPQSSMLMSHAGLLERRGEA